ncbi:MAG: VWA domain-containing protein [Acidobacteriota bacterium]
MRSIKFIFIILLVFISVNSLQAVGQSGKSGSAGRRNVTLNVIVHCPEGKAISKDDFELYDQAVQQEVETFYKVDAGSRIVLMIDSSGDLRVESEILQKAVGSLINELYEDDQMMIVGYNENAEIIEDMTPDLKKLQTSATKIIRKGFPNLFDALVAVTDALEQQAKTGIEKRAIILITDGYDSESKTKFDVALKTLQEANILLYALKVADRTRGALLRDKPKPPVVLEKLTGGTGGSIYPINKNEEAAKVISEDLRKNWYRLTYSPVGVNSLNDRKLLIMTHDKNVQLKIKDSHPGKYK